MAREDGITMAIPEAIKHFFFPIKPSRKSAKIFLKYLLIILSVVFAANFMVQTNALLRGTGQTISIGFILIPLAATLSSFKVWGFALSSAYVLTAIRVHSPKLNLFVLIFLAIALKFAWVFSQNVVDVMNTKLAIYEINVLHDANLIDEKYNGYHTFAKDSHPYILEAIALNPFTPQETLAKMAKINESMVNDRLDSLFYFQPNNGKGMSVKQLVASHPNTPKAVLETLSKDADPLVSKAAKESIIKRDTKH